MILRHQAIEIIDETLARVFRILEILSDVDRLDRTYFLAHAAEDAAELVDLVDNRIPISLIVLAGHQPNAIRRTNRRAQAARNALRTTVRMCRHDVRAAPAR